MRSMTPESMSVMKLVPAHAAPNSAIIMTMPGRQEDEVVVPAAEARNVDDRREQLPEQQQPDDRLDEVHHQVERHAHEGAQLACGQKVGVSDGGHAACSLFACLRSVCPV